MVGVGGGAVAFQLSVDSGAAGFGVLAFLKVVSQYYSSRAGRLIVLLTSSTRTPAPSPMTKPHRSASNGLDARCGAWLKLVARLFARAKPAIARG